MLIKVLAEETDLTSATTVGSATVVRLLNNQAVIDQVIRKDSDSNIIGSFTLAANEVAYVEKVASDTLEGGSNIKAAKVAFTN